MEASESGPFTLSGPSLALVREPSAPVCSSSRLAGGGGGGGGSGANRN